MLFVETGSCLLTLTITVTGNGSLYIVLIIKNIEGKLLTFAKSP